MKYIGGVVFLLLASTALAVPCQTESEARADALIGYFTAQAVAALLCEDRLGLTGMVDLRLRVRARYRPQIDLAAKIREDYFARAYGKTWKQDIVAVNRVFLTELLKKIHPTITTCTELESEFQRQLAEGWVYIAAKAEEGYLKGLQSGENRLCQPL